MGVKIFDLQLLVGREKIMGDRPKICIESIESCGKNLYIGTNNSTIHLYFLEISLADNHKSEKIKANHKTTKPLGMKKAVIQIKAATALNQLMVNCDNTLLLLSMLDLSINPALSAKIKNMKTFCVNERPTNHNPFSVEICVSFLRKRHLQIYQLQEDAIVPMIEVSMPEMAINFSIDNKDICVCTQSNYMTIDSETGTRQELLPFSDVDGNMPMIHCVAPSEFIIAATNALGVFVSPDGTSNKPPLQWSQSVFTTAVAHPYIIALDDEFITVHSILDQRQKQSIHFQGGSITQSCSGGMVLICSPKDVYLMVPIPLQTQLETLLSEKKVEEALATVQASKIKFSQERYIVLCNMVNCMSAFIYFQDFEFDDALNYFTEGKMDPRELISLFPELLPTTSNFNRAMPKLNNIADVRQMCQNDEVKISECKKFLALYLEMVCEDIFAHLRNEKKSTYAENLGSEDRNTFISEIIFATIHLFAELHKRDAIVHFLDQKIGNTARSIFLLELIPSDNVAVLVTHLKENECLHVAACMLAKLGDLDNALKTWHALVDKKIEDPSFPGLSYVANQLAEFCDNPQLLWHHSEWILRIDESAGAEVFTNTVHSRLKKGDLFKPDDVISFLHKYPSALLKYLHHLVMVENIDKEKFHTLLAVMHLDSIIKAHNQKDMASFASARLELQKVLRFSSLYRIQLVLEKAKEYNLYEEQVILYSKLSDYKHALETLVHKIKDPGAAKIYCLEQSKNNPEFKKNIFQKLLYIYVQDIISSNGNSGSTEAAIELLNNHSSNFDPESVLHSVPKQWSITVLSAYLHHSLREPSHQCRNKVLEYKLARSEVLNLQKQSLNLNSTRVVLKENRLCSVCNKVLSGNTFARYPNGVVVHTHCSKSKYICPVTGNLFRVVKKDD